VIHVITTDLLGADDAHLEIPGFYIINTWASRYRVVKNCNLLIEAAPRSTSIIDAEKKGYAGFAKTLKPTSFYYYLILLMTMESVLMYRTLIR
jgi:hypothetical protein